MWQVYASLSINILGKLGKAGKPTENIKESPSQASLGFPSKSWERVSVVAVVASRNQSRFGFECFESLFLDAGVAGRNHQSYCPTYPAHWPYDFLQNINGILPKLYS